jgi:molybdate transport system ATP-binding protein
VNKESFLFSQKSSYHDKKSVSGMTQKWIALEQVSVIAPGGIRILSDIDLLIEKGQQWALIGPSGSGKTVLAHTLLGRHFHQGRIEFFFDAPAHPLHQIAMVEQQHRFSNISGTGDLYYQQRFNAHDAEQTITVEQELEARHYEPSWLDTLHIRHLLPKPLIQLSNGENRRVQLAIALSGNPAFLIMDNPFLGLDTEGRSTLHGIFNRLAAGGAQILFITSGHEIPEAITHIARLQNGQLIFAGPKKDFLFQPPGLSTSASIPPPAPPMPDPPPTDDFAIAVKLVNTSIRYGETTILDGVNWEVRKGEKWGLSGPNGAGKSTILSLITADNPQAYANEIWLFDRLRGTGESIWDIKKRIGYISPELHVYFDRGATCFEVIASGLFDSIGLFRRMNHEQEETVLQWMNRLSLTGHRDRSLRELPAGQQRMALLARALIKNPSLLILDEPCQGLDDEQAALFNELVNGLCGSFELTLIYTSHYREEIPACVDRFLKLENGRPVT